MSNQKGHHSGSHSLAIKKPKKQTLTRNQETFNKLTLKIEKLQKSITLKQSEFDAALHLFGQELHPIQLKVTQSRHKIILALWEIYKSRKLSKADDKELKKIIEFHLEEYLGEMEQEPDTQIKEIYQKLNGLSFEAMKKREMAFEADSMREFMEDMGLDIEISDADIIDEKIMAQKMAQAREELRLREEKAEELKQRKKDKKAKAIKQPATPLKKESADQLNQKNISTLFKQLAKLFHPDLEQNPVKKIEKESLMQLLTNAYEKKDLHTLLMLEMRWVHQEQNQLENIADDKLKIYINILKEQIKDLEVEKFRISNQPQYRVLFEFLDFVNLGSPLNAIKSEVALKSEMHKTFERDISKFQSPEAFRYVKNLIRDIKKLEKNRSGIESNFTPDWLFDDDF